MVVTHKEKHNKNKHTNTHNKKYNKYNIVICRKKYFSDRYRKNHRDTYYPKNSQHKFPLKPLIMIVINI